MKWAYKDPVTEKDWHTWFAWRPIRVGDTKVWLETVYRKGKLDCGWGDCYWKWTYALDEFDILKHEES